MNQWTVARLGAVHWGLWPTSKVDCPPVASSTNAKHDDLLNVAAKLNSRLDAVVAPQALGYVIVDMTVGSNKIIGGVYYDTRKDAMDVADALDNAALNVCAVLVPEEA